MKKLVILAASALLFGFVGAANAEISKADLNQQIDQTNFLVNNGCSGTLVDKANGYILTANHCVQQQFQDVERDDLQRDGTVQRIKHRITVPGTVSQLTFDGSHMVAKNTFVVVVKAHDPDHDLALLKVKTKLPNAQDAQLACAEPQRGDTVYAVGNPDGDLYSDLTKGIVTSTQRDYRLLGIDGDGTDPLEQPGDSAVLEHSASIIPGNSGGALYDTDGNLIGVNVRYIPTTIHSFAVPLDDVRKFLTDNKVTLPTCP